MFNVNKKTQNLHLNPSRFGHREKSGRKSTWNNKETSTIRIPKAFEQELMRYARYLDNNNLDKETDSSLSADDFVIESNNQLIDDIDAEFDYETDSSFGTIKGMEDYSYLETETESRLKYQPMPSFMNAIFLAREIVRQKKCARTSLWIFISRFYATHFNSETLKNHD